MLQSVFAVGAAGLVGVRENVAVATDGALATDLPCLNLNDPAAVAANRARLAEALGLVRTPAWLEQVHGCDVAAAETVDAPVRADGSRVEASATIPCCR